MRVEQCAKSLAAAMKSNLHSRPGDSQRFRRLLGRHLLDVSKQEHDAVRWRKLFDGFPDGTSQLFALERFIHTAPRHRAFDLMSVGAEPWKKGLDAFFVAAPAQRPQL